MPRAPEKSEAPTVGAVEASDVKPQALTQGINMQDSTPATSGQSIATVAPDLSIVEGHVTTTSNQVAEHFGKRHADVIRAIRKLEAPAEFTERNFALSEFTDSTGRKLPAYRITRDGFTLLAMGFTGKEAMQWKVAYLTAFNKMEAELLARTTRPANPTLDYDRISPAQAQDLKEIVAAIVKSGVQGYGETWARLQKKFRVNSYLELPATQHLEARAYLIGKLPKGYAENVVDEAAKPASEAVPTLRNRRWLIATDHAGNETVQPVGADDFISNWPRLVKDIASGDCLLSNAELLALNHASSQRLMQRLGGNGPACIAS